MNKNTIVTMTPSEIAKIIKPNCKTAIKSTKLNIWKNVEENNWEEYFITAKNISENFIEAARRLSKIAELVIFIIKLKI
jgi:hypothetical protein